jgi:hypothetical protein
VYRSLNWGERPLTSGKIVKAPGTAVGLLVFLAGCFWKQGDWPITSRILDKAETELDKELEQERLRVIDLHYIYSMMIDSYYRSREDDPKALEGAVRACERQIALAPGAARALKKESTEKERQRKYRASLPYHEGFLILAIIREKQKDYAEAIRLSEQAKAQGWAGDWEERIVRCQKRLQKQS